MRVDELVASVPRVVQALRDAAERVVAAAEQGGAPPVSAPAAAGVPLLALKQVNREIQVTLEARRAALEAQQAELDRLHLVLENVSYERQQLRKEIDYLRAIRPQQSAVDLVPLEQFFASSAGAALRGSTDDHAVHVQRLEHELAERRRLRESVSEQTARLEALKGECAQRVAFLRTLQPKLAQLAVSMKPIAQEMDVEPSTREASAAAMSLAKPLFVVHQQAEAARIAGDSSVSATADARANTVLLSFDVNGTAIAGALGVRALMLASDPLGKAVGRVQLRLRYEPSLDVVFLGASSSELSSFDVASLSLLYDGDAGRVLPAHKFAAGAFQWDDTAERPYLWAHTLAGQHRAVAREGDVVLVPPRDTFAGVLSRVRGRFLSVLLLQHSFRVLGVERKLPPPPPGFTQWINVRVQLSAWRLLSPTEGKAALRAGAADRVEQWQFVPPAPVDSMDDTRIVAATLSGGLVSASLLLSVPVTYPRDASYVRVRLSMLPNVPKNTVQVPLRNTEQQLLWLANVLVPEDCVAAAASGAPRDVLLAQLAQLQLALAALEAFMDGSAVAARVPFVPSGVFEGRAGRVPLLFDERLRVFRTISV